MTDHRLNRMGADLGALIETHDAGLDRGELRRLYAAPDGGPDLDRFLRYCRDMFRIELTPQQVDGARALVTDRQVLIVGANGVGKDTLAALWALYELTVLGAEVILSAPTDRQVHEVLMRREVGRYFSRAAGKLRGQRFERAIRLPGSEDPNLIAFTATDPDKFTGHHAARLFIAVTEGQGIPADIFEAAQKCQPTRLLVTANPTTPACAAYGFAKSRAWTTLTWSALDHPNITTGETRVPGAVTRQWVEDRRREHGEDSRFWCVSVLARWPEEAESPLFMAGRWDEAVERGQAPGAIPKPGGPANMLRAVVGVDIARGGEDQTALAVRVGGVLWHLDRYREPELLVNAERIATEVRRLVGEGLGVVEVVIDETADGGGAFEGFARLAPKLTWTEYLVHRLNPDIVERRPKVTGFKSARQAPLPDRFANLRAQAFHHLGVQFETGRMAVRPGVDAALLADLREELLAHQRIHQADDRILIGSKDEIRRAIGRSPDLADALAMTFVSELEAASRRRIARVFG